MKKCWGIQTTDERLKVAYNKLGEPIGDNRSTYNEFLGAISRIGKYAPIDIKDWRKVPNSLKNEMVDVVKVYKL